MGRLPEFRPTRNQGQDGFYCRDGTNIAVLEDTVLPINTENLKRENINKDIMVLSLAINDRAIIAIKYATGDRRRSHRPEY